MGAREEWEPCTVNDCAVDGAWTEWSPWGYCDAPCGVGRRVRTQTCTAPAPENGGQECEPGGDNVREEGRECKIKVRRLKP